MLGSASMRVNGRRPASPSAISRELAVVAIVAFGIEAGALADRNLAQAVARHKSMFFAEKDAERRLIDYDAAVGGGLKLVPAGKGLEALSADYAAMIDDGLLLDEAEAFEKLIERCRDLERRANEKVAG